MAQAIIKGAGSRDFFGTACGQHDHKFDGFKFDNANVQLDDTLLLIETEAAQRYAARVPSSPPGDVVPPVSKPPRPISSKVPPLPKAHTFIGSADVNAATAKMRLVQIAEEIISILAGDPHATVTVSMEINADFPAGVSDQIKRAVSENAGTLGFKNRTWE